LAGSLFHFAFSGAGFEPCSPVPTSLFLYILLCQDFSLYIGITQNVASRLARYRYGTGSKFTRVHAPVRLVYTEGPLSEEAAARRERQLKRWSRGKETRVDSK
jgi:putative endonuclease